MYVSIKSWQYRKTGRTGPKVGGSGRYVGQTQQSAKAVLNRRRNSCISVEAVSKLPSKVTISDLQQLNKEELKAECRTRQLLLKGTKGDLVQRLWDFVEQEQGKSQKSQPASSSESKESPKKAKEQSKASASEVLKEPKTQPTKKPKSKSKQDEKPEVEESEETQLETKSDATAATSTKKTKASKKATKSVTTTPKKSEKLQSKLKEEEEQEKEEEPVAKTKFTAKKPPSTKKKTTDKQEAESKPIKSKKSPETASKPDVAKAVVKKTKKETEAKKEVKEKEPKTVIKSDTKDTTAQPKTPRRIVIKKNLKEQLVSAKDMIQIPAKTHEMIQERLQQQTEQKQKKEPPKKIIQEEKLEEEEIVPIESVEEKTKQQELEDQFIMRMAKEKLEEEKMAKEKLEEEKREREKKQKAEKTKQIQAKKKQEDAQQQQVPRATVTQKKELQKKLIQSKKLEDKKEEDVDTVEMFQVLYMAELEDELSKKSAKNLSLPWIPGKSDVGMEQFKSYEEFEKFCKSCTSVILYLSCGFWRIPVLQKQRKQVYAKALWNAFMVEKTRALPQQGQKDTSEESTQSEEKQMVKTSQRRKSGAKKPEADLKAATAAAAAAAAAATDVNEQEGREVDLRVESVGGSGLIFLDEEDDPALQEEEYIALEEYYTSGEMFYDQPEYMVRRPEGGISVFKEPLEGPISDEVSAEGNKDMDFEYHENQRLFSLMDSTAGYQAFSDDDVDIEEATDEEGDKLVWTKSDEEDFEIDMVEMIDQVGEDTLSELDNLEVEHQQQIEDMMSEEELSETEEEEEEQEGELVEGATQEPQIEGEVVLESENPRKKPTMSKKIPQQFKQDSQSSDEEVASLDDYQRKSLGTVSRTPDISDSESEEEEEEEIVSSSDQEEEKGEALQLEKSAEGVEIKEVKESIDFKFPPVDDLKQAGEQIAEQIREEIIHKKSSVSDANPEDIKEGEIIAQQFRETILKEAEQIPQNGDKQRIKDKKNFNEWILNVQNFRRSTPVPVSWYDEGKEIHKTLSLQQVDYQEEKQKYMKSVLQRLQDDYNVTFREQELNVQNSGVDKYLQEKKIQPMDVQKVQTTDTTLNKQQINQDEQFQDLKLQKRKEEEEEEEEELQQINQSLQNVGDLRESGEVSSEADSEKRKDVTISEEKKDESKTMKISKEQQDEKDKTMKISQEQREKQKSQDVLAEGLKLIGKFFKPFL